MSRPVVTDVAIVFADDAVAASGLEAWCSLTVNGLRVDSVTVRTTAGGELRVALPARKSGSGVLHPVVVAVDPDVEAAITTAVLSAYIRERARRR